MLKLTNLTCIAILGLALQGCGIPAVPASLSSSEAQRMEEYDRQMALVAEQQAEVDRQLQRAEEQQDRLDALHERWEAQADRFDAILSQWERQQAAGK